MLNKEIRPCSEQTPSHLAAAICLWVPAALCQPRARTSTLLQPPAWWELLCSLRDCSLPKTKATKDQRCRRHCPDIVAFFLTARSTERVTFCQAVGRSWEVNKRSRGEGKCGHRWACGWCRLIWNFLNLARHGKFSFELFSKLEICLSSESVYALNSRVEKTLTYSLETSF